MLLGSLREAVLEANLALPRHGLVTFTWGNVSGIDRERGWVVIKPSGVRYEEMRASDMVILDLHGERIEGKLRPSSDTPTHLWLYRELKDLGGIVHTHSTHATAWAQAGRDIPALGTTHADYFYGPVPCTRALTHDEVERDYELSTGRVIVQTLRDRQAQHDAGASLPEQRVDHTAHYDKAQSYGAATPLSVPGILVREHAPFAWGCSPQDAVHNAVVLEELARMALYTVMLNPAQAAIPDYLLDKHFLRKHGSNAYYGQPLSDTSPAETLPIPPTPKKS